jgi:hypothetical protein
MFFVRMSSIGAMLSGAFADSLCHEYAQEKIYYKGTARPLEEFASHQ